MGGRRTPGRFFCVAKSRRGRCIVMDRRRLQPPHAAYDWTTETLSCQSLGDEGFREDDIDISLRLDVTSDETT